MQSLRTWREEPNSSAKVSEQARFAYEEEMKKQVELEVEKTQKLANIEAEKFKKYMESMGPGTLEKIVTGPLDHQAKLINALGLKSMLITNSTNPINLLNIAKGSLQTIRCLFEAKASSLWLQINNGLSAVNID